MKFIINYKFFCLVDGDTRSALMGVMKNVISLTVINQLSIIWVAISSENRRSINKLRLINLIVC